MDFAKVLVILSGAKNPASHSKRCLQWQPLNSLRDPSFYSG